MGFELHKLKKKKPAHYQAVCPACRAITKISVKEMQSELDQATEDIQKMVAEYEAEKAKAKDEKKAKVGKKAKAEARAKAKTKAN